LLISLAATDSLAVASYGIKICGALVLSDIKITTIPRKSIILLAIAS